LGPTTHIVQLHHVILLSDLLFLWEAHCFPCLFRCLLLKCLSHPKWSHSVIAPLTSLSLSQSLSLCLCHDLCVSSVSLLLSVTLCVSLSVSLSLFLSLSFSLSLA
jgi:hypothetical protein